MTYAETLHYLYEKLPLFSRTGAAAIKKDLHNTVALCAALGNPEKKFKSIHIAGTNGKGSVSHMLAAVLQSAGYKTGLYTSPHLYDFRERIRIDGTMISEKAVVDFVERIRPQITLLEPSFFEVTVAMAFQYFADEDVDIAVIEVGLGGRLDSTNVIEPELSVITNIGMDHMNLLGETLPLIATEKAGIIKYQTPVVIGERHSETASVFEAKAAEQNAPIFFAEDHFIITHYNAQPKLLSIQIQESTSAALQYSLDLPGLYQLKNIRTVLMAIRLMQQMGWKIAEPHVQSGLMHVKSLTGLMGRWEVLKEQPLVVLDVAHNPDGIRQMLQHVEQLKPHKLHLVLGMVKDKDVESVLDMLPHNAIYYFTNAHIPRALPASDLQQKAAAACLRGEVYEDVNSAIASALSDASVDDMVIICGSVFLVAEVDRTKITG